MSYTISYVRTYDIVRTTYDIVKKTYDVVRFYPFLASRTCDVVYDVVYDIVCFWTTSYVQHTISPKNVRCRTFLPVSCHFDVRHRIRYRTFFDDVAYDVQDNIGIIRSRTSGSDVVGTHRHKHTIYGYDVVCNIAAYDMPYVAYDMLAWGGGRRGGTYWPCPSSSHGSCFLILGPAGWSVLHRHSVDPLSLSLAQGAVANVGGDCLV